MFSVLLWRCLAPGEYTVEENNLSATLTPLNGMRETILVFDKLDDRRLPDHYAGADRACCDAIFFYSRNLADDAGPLLLFVELKGTDIRRAIEQLKNTMREVEAAVRPESLRGKTRRRAAVIVTKATVPQLVDMRPLVSEFRRELKASIYIEQEAQGRRVDLRGYVDRFHA
jgi:hypothetical protein